MEDDSDVREGSLRGRSSRFPKIIIKYEPSEIDIEFALEYLVLTLEME